MLCSFFPVALNNYRHCGDWTGLKAENALFHKPDGILFATRGTLLLAAQNFSPPVLPLAAWTERVVNDAMPAWLVNWFSRDETSPGWGRIQFREMVAEEDAGWGFGLSCLLLVQLIVGTLRRIFTKTSPECSKVRGYFLRVAFLVSPFVSLMVFQFKSSLSPVARTILPYYALLLPFCLVISGVEWQVRRRWWKVLGLCVFLFAGLSVLVIPERPLWPALTALKKLESCFHSPALARATTVYETYRARSEVLSPLIEALPNSTQSIGLISVTEPEAGLWRPFGSRRVFHILSETKPDEIAACGIERVIINVDSAPAVLKMPLADWLEKFNATVEKTMIIRVFASGPPNTYQLVRIARENAPRANAKSRL